MKKNILVLVSIVSLFISCSNFVDVDVEKSAGSKNAVYTVTGSLVSGYEDGASSRSAFPANDVNLSLYTTSFYYKSSPTATERELCGTTTNDSFELKLPSLGTYYLEAESYLTSDGTKTVALKTTSPVELTLTEDNPSKNDVRMFLKIIVNTSGEGSIDLYMKSFDTSKVVTMEIYEDNEIISDGSFIFSNGNDSTVNWKADNVGAGPHTYTFKFYSDSSSTELVYQCTETITILPGKTTDTWVNNGNAEYFKEEGAGFSTVTVMKITQTCLDNFAFTNFYVNPDVTTSGNGSYFEPVQTLKEAVEKCVDSFKNYTINIMGDIEVNSGFTVSKSITIQKAPEATYAKIQYSSTSNCLFSVSASNTLKISNIDIEGPDVSSSQSGGAAIYNRGTLILNNVNLSKFNNVSSTNQGGCLYNAGNGIISITGGSITSCASGEGGAIYNAGDIEIKDCTISSCTAQTGGAIYNYNAAKITLSGNTSITSCTASSNGGGIYDSGTTCKVYMKDSAYLDSASDIMVWTNACVILTGNLTPPEAARGIAATITPKAYTGGIKILDESTPGLIADNYLKFALISTDEDPSIQWTIDNTGKLKKEILVSSLTAAPTDTNAVYKLSTVADLSKIAGWVNGGVTLVDIKFELTDDIRIDSTWTPIGHYEYGNEKYFKGHFDGLGHTITYNTENVGQNFAFIGALQNGSVSNLNATGTIRGTNTTCSSPIVGYIEDSGNISNCTSSVDMELSSSESCGGIVGYACIYNVGEIIIENCINRGNIICNQGSSVGGIAGVGYGGVFKNCINNGKITASAMAGGIVGQIRNNPTVTNCGNTGDITVNWENDNKNSGAGGIVAGANAINEGWGKATITNCWSTGTIQSININSNCAGGIYGNYSTLTRNECISSNCYYLSGSCDRAVGNIEGPVEEILIFTGTQNNYTVNGTDFVDILNQNVSGEMKRWKYGADGYPVFE